MFNWIDDAIDAVESSIVGWTYVIVGTLIMGFLGGYWTGHGKITDIGQTAVAFAKLPLLWLGNPEMFAAYAVTVFAWYLPQHYESRAFKWGSAAANLLIWFVVVRCVVIKWAGSKFLAF